MDRFCLSSPCPAQSPCAPQRSVMITVRPLCHSLGWDFFGCVAPQLRSCPVSSTGVPTLKAKNWEQGLTQQDGGHTEQEIPAALPETKTLVPHPLS